MPNRNSKQDSLWQYSIKVSAKAKDLRAGSTLAIFGVQVVAAIVALLLLAGLFYAFTGNSQFANTLSEERTGLVIGLLACLVIIFWQTVWSFIRAPWKLHNEQLIQTDELESQLKDIPKLEVGTTQDLDYASDSEVFVDVFSDASSKTVVGVEVEFIEVVDRDSGNRVGRCQVGEIPRLKSGPRIPMKAVWIGDGGKGKLVIGGSQVEGTNFEGKLVAYGEDATPYKGSFTLTRNGKILDFRLLQLHESGTFAVAASNTLSKDIKPLISISRDPERDDVKCDGRLRTVYVQVTNNDEENPVRAELQIVRIEAVGRRGNKKFRQSAVAHIRQIYVLGISNEQVNERYPKYESHKIPAGFDLSVGESKDITVVGINDHQLVLHTRKGHWNEQTGRREYDEVIPLKGSYRIRLKAKAAGHFCEASLLITKVRNKLPRIKLENG